MDIQEAAESSGLSADTLRFYEREGVLPRTPRRPNGYREYTEEHLATLRLASGLRGIGLPLADIRVIVGVAHDGTCGELRGALQTTLSGAVADIDQRLSELRRTKAELTSILKGLSTMRSRERRVPGLKGCPCVRVVAGDRPAPTDRRAVATRRNPASRSASGRGGSQRV